MQLDVHIGYPKPRTWRNTAFVNAFNFTKVLLDGPWYKDQPESRYSRCQLHDVATEFACHGLELDFRSLPGEMT
jgi:hypothetical protein